MAKKKERATSIEWVGGIVTMPAYVTDDGDPYWPEALFWMGAEGAVLGHVVGRPGEVLGLASKSLREAMARPIWGRPHAPSHVRVASPELAEVLRAGHPGLDVVCGPTPELDGLLGAMKNSMAQDASIEESYLTPEVGPAAMAALFRAAARLYRARPWKVIPEDDCLFSVTIDKLGIRDAALSVIGQMGESHGLVFFASLEDFYAFLEASDALERGEEPSMPPHFALNFQRGAELSPALRKEITAHRWEVAAADAYPWLMAVDESMSARPPTAEEMTIAEALALALPEVLKEKNALEAAWRGGEPVLRTLSVKTFAGELEITLRAPYEEAAPFRPPHDILADLQALEEEEDGDEIDPDAREELEDELFRRFSESPEAEAIADISICPILLDYAASYFGVTIATLGPRDLRELLFELFPRKVSVEADEARAMIDEIRAFFAFLKRTSALPTAEACLEVLGGDAAAKLEAALSDPSKFGMAKSFVMAGREAGFDTTTTAGIQAWMSSVQAGGLPPSVRLPSAPSPRLAPKSTAKTKNQRKAARRARKKSR